MAKELPYFKFEPNQWENGNIQMLSREDKGLFMDLCSMYWSRLGDVPLKLAVQKLCGGNATAFDSLISEQIFEVIDDRVCINYLNEQLGEFDNVSEQNSKNAKARWEKHRKQKDSSDRNATASNPQCESDAIREEKRREEKSREDNIIKKVLLSEIKISDVPLKELDYYNAAIAFQKIFHENIKSVGGNLRHVESAEYIKWVSPIRLMVESDKVEKDGLVKVYEFLKTNDFWKSNIQSTKKLREKYNTLILQANETRKSTSKMPDEYLRQVFS